MVGEKRAPQVVVMPYLGESSEEGVVARFFKRPGESVKRDEPVLAARLPERGAVRVGDGHEP